mmetsp:Transcript_159751/g.512645  ORF Transcript_159751/g.512645 Transcript_159751/m.512645 type:complete len:313 (+) Transcript_159751:5103-6041(+)
MPILCAVIYCPALDHHGLAGPKLLLLVCLAEDQLLAGVERSQGLHIVDRIVVDQRPRHVLLEQRRPLAVDQWLGTSRDCYYQGHPSRSLDRLLVRNVLLLALYVRLGSVGDARPRLLPPAGQPAVHPGILGVGEPALPLLLVRCDGDVCLDYRHGKIRSLLHSHFDHFGEQVVCFDGCLRRLRSHEGLRGGQPLRRPPHNDALGHVPHLQRFGRELPRDSLADVAIGDAACRLATGIAVVRGANDGLEVLQQGGADLQRTRQLDARWHQRLGGVGNGLRIQPGDQRPASHGKHRCARRRVGRRVLLLYRERQ